MRQAEVQSLFLQRFGKLFPQFRFRNLRHFPHHSHTPYSFALRVAVGQAEQELDLLCVALTEGYPQEVQRFAERIAEVKMRPSAVDAVPVLLAEYFPKDARALCRQERIGYFDLAGNVGLDASRVYVLIDRRTDKREQKEQTRSPFAGKSERVARRMLLEAERRWKMRELAREAGVSLGLASMATSALAERGFVAKGREGVSLFDPAGLLDAWTSSYDFRRNPFIIYRSEEDAGTLEARLVAGEDAPDGRYALTLWSGAHHLLPFEEPPTRLALYWTGEPESLARSLALRRDTGQTGVFVFQPYDEGFMWGATETQEGLHVVHPLQLYLDLASGDEQELQLAQRVRECCLPW